MLGDAAAARVAEHIAAFNQGVVSGEWSRFADRFALDATMAFLGVPAGPFHGRDRIRTAYAENPPDDTMTVTAVESNGDTDAVAFTWDRGGSGSMRITWAAGLVTALEVAFSTA